MIYSVVLVVQTGEWGMPIAVHPGLSSRVLTEIPVLAGLPCMPPAPLQQRLLWLQTGQARQQHPV